MDPAYPAGGRAAGCGAGTGSRGDQDFLRACSELVDDPARSLLEQKHARNQRTQLAREPLHPRGRQKQLRLSRSTERGSKPGEKLPTPVAASETTLPQSAASREKDRAQLLDGQPASTFASHLTAAGTVRSGAFSLGPLCRRALPGRFLPIGLRLESRSGSRGLSCSVSIAYSFPY